MPVSTGKGSVEATVTPKDGTATITVTDTQIKEIVSGTEAADTVEIDAFGLKADAAVLPSARVSAVGTAADVKGLAVTLPAGTVTLDKSALEAVSGKGDIKLSVETVDNAKLSEAQKAALGTQTSTARVFDVNIYAGRHENQHVRRGENQCFCALYTKSRRKHGQSYRLVRAGRRQH